jgi:serine/threonine-protein kinase RsbT
VIRELHVIAVKHKGDSAPEAMQVAIVTEQDIVTARVGARTFAQHLGFGSTDQAKIATAVSELARNIQRYAGKGSVSISALSPPQHGMRIIASDEGPGIPNLQEILAGEYKSRTGLGLGIVGCKRLMDEFSITSEPGKGTCITLAKYLARTK